MKSRSVLLIVSVIIVFLVIIAYLWPISYTYKVILGGKTFIVDVADTKSLQEKGLSGRDFIANDGGMFFVFKTPNKHGFWMKDMKFPIDIIWIDANFKIIHIENRVHQGTYPTVFYPPSPALYVLEVTEGQSDALKIKIGDSVKFLRK